MALPGMVHPAFQCNSLPGSRRSVHVLEWQLLVVAAIGNAMFNAVGRLFPPWRASAWRGGGRICERRVIVWPVSCGVAGGGAGYAATARRAGFCCPLVSAGRPRRVPPRRRWVENHPPRPGAQALAWLPSCHHPSLSAWCPGSARDRCRTQEASVRQAGCTGLDAGLASEVRVVGPARPGAPRPARLAARVLVTWPGRGWCR
jgi:hypothetical protein